jgi:hypothetical protein
MTEDRMKTNPRITTCEELETIVAQQNELINGMADLLKAMDEKLRRYVQLVDIHEAALEKVGVMRAAREDENPGGIVH